MNWLISFCAWFYRRKERRARRRDKKLLAIRVQDAPDFHTLDSLGQERRKTHVRTRPDLY